MQITSWEFVSGVRSATGTWIGGSLDHTIDPNSQGIIVVPCSGIMMDQFRKANPHKDPRIKHASIDDCKLQHMLINEPPLATSDEYEPQHHVITDRLTCPPQPAGIGVHPAIFCFRPERITITGRKKPGV